MPIPPEILDLVERYKRNREEYESGKYNEAQLRQEFLNPFFKALGWDVTNEKGYSQRDDQKNRVKMM
jgi:predicted type IV restriction endonuclease